jgi:two-component system, LytTR family, response regulator
MTAAIRTLIVDDEPLARSRVRRFLAGEEGVEVVGECEAGREAVEAVRELKPELVFLDIQMPELDGFGVIEAVGPARMPAVVFLTAYDRYALRAFDVHALDYLLKPYTRERFRRSLARARRLLSSRGAGADGRLASLVESLGREQRYLEWLTVKSAGRVFFLRVDDLEWVEAEGNYLRLHAAGGGSHLLRETLNGLASRLDPRKFLRIHRSTLVRAESVRELRPTPGGDYEVLLRDGTRLTLSRGYRDRVLDSFYS